MQLLSRAPQRQFGEEDRMIAAERAGLTAAAERLFDCGVCMPEESIASIEPCGYSFRRECVFLLIMSQIESRRFPVLCPPCTAAAERTELNERCLDVPSVLQLSLFDHAARTKRHQLCRSSIPRAATELVLSLPLSSSSPNAHWCPWPRGPVVLVIVNASDGTTTSKRQA
jgi:hypothetical protein